MYKGEGEAVRRCALKAMSSEIVGRGKGEDEVLQIM